MATQQRGGTRMAETEHGTSLQLLEALLQTRQQLESDIASLTTQREETGRFLQIDEELAELNRLARRKEVLIGEADAEAAAIRETARREAESTLTEAAQQALRMKSETAAKAQQDRETILREANQAAFAQRQSAEAVYAEARQKTAKVDEDLAGRIATTAKKEQDLKAWEQLLATREAGIGRSEAAVDSKRSMLLAAVESLRRTLDNLMV